MENLNYYGYQNRETWKSVEFKEPEIIVDYRIPFICKYIQEKVGNKEFSILFKTKMISNGYKVLPEYYIPEQTVTASSVDFDDGQDIDQKINEGFNCIIHSHPFAGKGSTSFSSGDNESINKNFDVSLLLNGEAEITDAIINIRINDSMYLQIKNPKISMESDIEIEGLERIKEKVYPVSTTWSPSNRVNQPVWRKKERKTEKKAKKKTNNKPIDEETLIKKFKELEEKDYSEFTDEDWDIYTLYLASEYGY